MSVKIRAEKKWLWLGAALAVGVFCVFAALHSPVVGAGSAAALLVLCLLELEISDARLSHLLPMFLAVMTAAVTVVLVQYCAGFLFYASAWSDPLRLVGNWLLYLAVIGVLCILTGNVRLSCLTTLAAFLTLATVNYYVFQARGSELAIMEFLNIRTAANTMGYYQLTAGRAALYCWIGALLWSGFLMHCISCSQLPPLLTLGKSLLRIEVHSTAKCEFIPIILAIVSALINFVLVQYNTGVLSYVTTWMGFFRFFLNITCYFAIIAFFYALTRRIRMSCILTLVITLGLATANHFIVEFRGSALKLIDLLSIQTALNVAGNYHFTIDRAIICSWFGAFLWGLVLMRCISFVPSPRKRLHRGVSLAAACLCIVFLANNMDCLTLSIWMNGGPAYNGFLLNFLMGSVTLEKPEDYDSLDLAALEEQYSASAQAERTPHILVIMDEAFSDLRVFGDLNTDISVMPFFDSLEEDAIKGYFLSSVYGGNTANSEWEFLTGNTMAFLPTGSVAYHQYVENDTYSLTTYLKSLGYYCIAMHPYIANGWMRSTVWPYLNFDESHFIDDFPSENLVRDYVSDQEMFEQILEALKNNETGQPLFLFGVTMQNHGDYDYDGDNFTKTISLEGYSQDYPMAEQYLSLIHETDTALEYLITGLQELDEDVIVLFYGDHQPKIESDLLEELYGGPLETLEADELRYAVPFLIWANFDIPEDTVTLTSLNYLSSPLLEAAGISLPSYNRFLEDVEAAIPAMNARGYYSAAQQAFLDYDDASGEEAALLELYQNLQYHSIKETENRSTVFFPFAQS